MPQLLLGEVPERSVFNQKGFIVALKPYLALTQAVRQGDLVEFNSVVKGVRSREGRGEGMVVTFYLFICKCDGFLFFSSFFLYRRVFLSYDVTLCGNYVMYSVRARRQYFLAASPPPGITQPCCVIDIC